ncbi:MAG: chemotaxis protein CheX [Syntrophomonadaceae bacterium]|nr:chemotaxis protein CheX [Syntrophomonadaceae bacterium]
MSIVQIAPFVAATVKVFKDMLETDIVKGQPEPEGDSFISRGFSVMVGLTGGWEGWFLLDMSQETACIFARAMTGEDYDTVENEEVLYAGAEIANIISGNAITTINNLQPGLNIRLAPPSVFAGQGMSMFNARLSSSSVLMESAAGPVKINVAAKEGK